MYDHQIARVKVSFYFSAFWILLLLSYIVRLLRLIENLVAVLYVKSTATKLHELFAWSI